jgi:murein DD-endopeptidase MepM/ murein hydrolase activator NlpD
MKLPVKNPIITSHYGKRVLNNVREFHDGVDFIDSQNQRQVYSILPGVCVYDFDSYKPDLAFTDKQHSGGNMIIIDSVYDNEHYFIRYLHLLNNDVSIKSNVNESDIIGVYADVGRSYGAHLHIDAYDKNWIKFNIEDLFSKDGLM